MALQSQTDICNLALQWLGEDPILTFEDAPEPESDTYARKRSLCKLNYPNARDAVLEDGDWTFANRFYNLGQLADPIKNDPRPPITGNAFQVPGDVLRIIQCDDGSANWNLPWIKLEDRVFIEAEQCYADTIVRIEDSIRYTPGFVQALAARLAADLAIPVRDSRSLQQDMWALYQSKLAGALANDGRQGTEPPFRSNKFRIVRHTGTIGTGNTGIGTPVNIVQ